VRGEVGPKALHYSRQTGARDFCRRGYGEASAAYAQAREALGHLPPDRDAAVLAVERASAEVHVRERCNIPRREVLAGGS